LTNFDNFSNFDNFENLLSRGWPMLLRTCSVLY